jgi:hypothetical protein
MPTGYGSITPILKLIKIAHLGDQFELANVG